MADMEGRGRRSDLNIASVHKLKIRVTATWASKI